MNIKTLILVIINSLIVFVVALLSISFYKQFSKVLNDRVLLQLNSIKTLKQIQFENLIHSEWDDFLISDETYAEFENFRSLDSLKNYEGIYDFTPNHINNETSICFVSNTENGVKFKVLNYSKIKEILLERTGMGSSGESYLVGSDYRMRSQSRFFPNTTPYNLVVKTNGVINGLKNKEGRGVFKDYRGIDVYSVYNLIEISNLKLVILSEINVNEVAIPLQNLKKRLISLTIGILIVAVVLSLFLTRIITNPIKNMQKGLKVMAKGDYTQSNEFIKNSIEIKDMFSALAQLKGSLQGAVQFSVDVGNMNLNTDYKPKGDNDLLGISLIAMRDKLLEFRNNEENNRVTIKRMLVNGLENERRRLSRELHDGVGPYLTFLKHYIENKIEDENQKIEMKRLVDDAISEIRLMSNALMPSLLDDFGVGATLTNLVENLKKSTDINIEYENLTKNENTKITNHQDINLFRICQELINNTLKYAKAKNIRITLSEFDDFISLFYFDDGIGFDENNVKLGSGIINIKERVEICNGKIEIHSETGSTTFEIELPVEL